MTNSSIIKCGQLNLQNSIRATSEARHLIQSFKLDFLAIQEPYTIDGKVKGFGLSTSNTIIGNTSNHIRPMAAIVADPISEPLHLAQHQTTHFTVIRLKTGPSHINLISAYFQCADPIGPYLDHLQGIVNSLRGQDSIVCADANAHSPLWHDREEDDKGSELTNFITRNNLQIINKPGQPPTHSSGRNIDLTLSTISLLPKIRNWTVHQGVSLSDHSLITFEILLRYKGSNRTINKFNLKQVDYQLLNEQITNNCTVLQNMPHGNPFQA